MNARELQLILEEGEGYRIEFKESFSSIDRDMVAFANASGGKIFLGITDDKKVKGVTIDNKLKSQIQDLANNCEPSIKILFEESRNLLIIAVKEGEDKPYRCASGFYTRVGPNSQKLNRNGIIEFIKAEGKIRFDELVNLKFDYKKDFDHKKFDRFLRLAGISTILDTVSILTNLDVAEKQKGRVIFNNTGILFFPKNLQDIYFHTAVTCALYKGTEKVDVLDRRDFNEDIISNINGAMNFLKQYIPVRYEMTGTPRRNEIPEIPYDAMREAIINAVTHRDYFEKGANVMVEMFDDRIEITNPGGLVKGLRVEDFGKKSVLRNPNIANLLHRIKYIEKMGTGISKIRTLIKSAGLPPVKFEFGTFFTATFTRPEVIEVTKRVGLTGELVEKLVEGLVESQKKMVSFIVKNPRISKKELAIKIGISTTAIDKNIAALKKKGLLKRIGPDKGGYWEISEEK